ncbi:MAG: hypothetical protein M0P31_00640 [Solirubrobacteraceae bacterium]|nr:hypothetical protein [Solirubrobacteraceae bacterium]
MAKKTDAFGREIDEDPLAGLRAAPGPARSSAPDPWGRGGAGTDGGDAAAGHATIGASSSATPFGSGASDASPIPEPFRALMTETLGTDDPAELERRAAMASVTGRSSLPQDGTSRIVRCVVGWLVLSAVLAVVAGIVGAVISAVDSSKDVAASVQRIGDGLSGGAASTPSTSSGSVPSDPPSDPPVGLAKGSMLRPGEFGRALTHLRAAGGRSRSLSVRPDRVNAVLRLNDGRSRNVSIDWKGARRIITTPGSSSTVGLTSLRGVESRAPSRAVNGAARLLGRPVSRVDYVVLSTAGTLGTRWIVFFKGGGNPVFTDASGRNASRTPG